MAMSETRPPTPPVSPSWLRERLAREDGVHEHIPGDQDHPQGERGLVPAAVLVGLVAHRHGPGLLLTQRTEHLRDHAGQISLPGGRMEEHEATPEATALREAHEEIGLAPERVELLGRLRPYRTITGFLIHPVVGWIRPPVELVADPFEVAEVFELPLAFALDPANHRRDSYEREGRRRHFFVLPYEDRYIWGATAGILVNFARMLRS